MYYFLVNITGGGGRTKKIWHDLSLELKDRDVRYKAYKTKGDEHVRALAGRISELPDDEDIRLVVVGGDGTINNVLNGIRNFDRVALAVIPTGSGNDFARGLGIAKDPVAALQDILGDKGEEPVVRRIDLGKVTWEGGERVFGISAGAGLDALVCKQALTSRLKNVLNKINMGQMIYSLLTVKDLFTMKYIKGRAVLGGAEMFLDKMIFLAAMNFSCEGGGVPMAPDACSDDGVLSVCLAAGVPKLRTFLCFPRLLAAKHQNLKGFTLRDCADLKLEFEIPVVVHADGEYVGDLSSISIECLPGRLRCLQ